MKMTQVPILFLLLLNKNTLAGTYNQVVKCCKAGWELSEEQDFDTSLQCVPSKGSGGQENKLRISLTEESIGIERRGANSKTADNDNNSSSSSKRTNYVN